MGMGGCYKECYQRMAEGGGGVLCGRWVAMVDG